MVMPTRVVTLVDLDDRVDPPEVRDAPVIDGPAPAGWTPAALPGIHREPEDESDRMSLTALHHAVLDDGRRITLLDDRGWSVSGPPDLWQRTTAHDIADDARMVVGPDEPHGDRTHADMAADHWAGLAEILREHGAIVSGADLSRLPHEVELSQRLRERLGRT